MGEFRLLPIAADEVACFVARHALLLQHLLAPASFLFMGAYALPLT